MGARLDDVTPAAPPLFIAVQNNHLDIVDLLLKAKVSIKCYQSKDTKRSLIHAAAAVGNIKLLSYLIERVSFFIFYFLF